MKSAAGLYISRDYPFNISPLLFWLDTLFFLTGGILELCLWPCVHCPKNKNRACHNWFLCLIYILLYYYNYIIIFIIYTYKYVNKSQRMPLNPLQPWQTWVLTLFKMQRFRLFLGQCGIGNNFWDSVPLRLLLSPAFVNREIMFLCVYML